MSNKNTPRKKTTASWSTSSSSSSDKWQRSTLLLNSFDDLDLDHNDTEHYLESEISQLEREGPITPGIFEEFEEVEEVFNIGQISVRSDRYFDDGIDNEEKLESAKLQIDMKHQQNDSKSNLEEETKDLQIEEQNAMIDEVRSSDLQSLAKHKEFAEEDQDSKEEDQDLKEKDNRLKALPKAMKRQEKKRIDSVISRVLCVSWKKHTGKGVFLPYTAAAYMQRKKLPDFDDSSLFIHQALTEILFMFPTEQDPLKNITVDISSDCNGHQASPPLNPAMTSPSYQFPILTSLAGSPPQSKNLNYLLDCYSRIATEKRKHPKRSSVSSLSDVLTILRKKCVEFSSFVLKELVGNYCYIYQGLVISTYSTHLLHPILSQSLPHGYLHELMAETCTKPNIFNQIFTPVLQGLFLLMQRASLVGNTHRRPIRALRELIEICCGPSNNIRPICSLIINQIQFWPDVVTSIAGREFTTNSFLGPFLSVSIFTEEVAEKFFSDDSVTDKSVIFTLQRELQSTRTSLYKIFDAILANNKCRDAILEYFTVLLRYNEKRAKIQTKEDASSLAEDASFLAEDASSLTEDASSLAEDASSLAEDGFMLNLLSILQMLSMKIELDTVDPLYPFNSSIFIEIKKDTRLKLTWQEAVEWQKQLESTHKGMEPTFSTKCWFLTLHCHHIALIPALRTYRKTLQELQNLQKNFDEYQTAKLQREDNILTGIEVFIEQQWTQQLKQLVKSKSCAEAGLIDLIFLKRCFHFYASMAEILLSILTQTAPGSPLPELPLPEEVTRNYTALPEWYIGDIVEFLLFTFEFCPEVMESNMDNSLITLLLVIVCTPDCSERNPYLIAQIIGLFVDMHLNIEGKMKTLYNKVMAHSISKTSLASYLMKFYTDIEIIGSDYEFDDDCKFEIHNDISIILKLLWDSSMHRWSILNESKNGKHFNNFINSVIKDIPIQIQKVLEFLKRVCEMEHLMSDTVAWTALSEEQQQLNTKQLVADEEKALYFFQFANETIDMLHYLIVIVRKPFPPELLEQLCTMLNFNQEKFKELEYIILKNVKQSRVEKTLECWKRLRILFRKLFDTYLKFNCNMFATAVANRKFCKELFIYYANEIEERFTKTSSSLVKIKKFLTLIERNEIIMRGNAQRGKRCPCKLDYARKKLHRSLMNIQDPVKLPCATLRFTDKTMTTRNSFDGTIRVVNKSFNETVQEDWRRRLDYIIQDPIKLSSIVNQVVIIGNSTDSAINATDE